MGNLDSLRDWGHARDYVEMQWRMLQQQGVLQDFVIATSQQIFSRYFPLYQQLRTKLEQRQLYEGG